MELDRKKLLAIAMDIARWAHRGGWGFQYPLRYLTAEALDHTRGCAARLGYLFLPSRVLSVSSRRPGPVGICC